MRYSLFQLLMNAVAPRRNHQFAFNGPDINAANNRNRRQHQRRVNFGGLMATLGFQRNDVHGNVNRRCANGNGNGNGGMMSMAMNRLLGNGARRMKNGNEVGNANARSNC